MIVHIFMTELTENHHKTSQQHLELGQRRIELENKELDKIMAFNITIFNIYLISHNITIEFNSEDKRQYSNSWNPQARRED